MKFLLGRAKWGIYRLLIHNGHVFLRREGDGGRGCRSGVANWSKIRFVVDFRNLLFGRDFDLSFSKGYSLMNFFNL